MSLQAMPIATQILTPGCVVQTQIDGNGQQVLAPAPIVESAKTAFRFNVQVASELYWRGKQNDYHLGSDFGSLRLPYPQCWMEWEWPSTIVVDGKESPAPHQRRCAAGMAETQIDDDRYQITTQLMFQSPPSPVSLVSEVGDSILVDKAGNYIQDSRKWMYALSLEEEQARALGRWLCTEVNVAYLALNLMHCKNVDTAKAGDLHVRRSGRAKRLKEPRLDFHTIILPGMSTSSDADSTNLDVMPLHRVRGHFKTFTDERPLLGKFTGTYWWGWQVRGNKKNGVTVTDYKVGI